MTHGKKTCRILKEIRRQIAEANGIEYATSECRFKGDCTGTCPRCEAELRELEQQLRARSLAGKMVRLAGISAGALALLSPTASAAEPQKPESPATTQEQLQDEMYVRGTVFNALDDGTIDTLIGVSVKNKRNGMAVATDLDGKFRIAACPGDTLTISYIGYETCSVTVNAANPPLEISMIDEPIVMGEIIYLDRSQYNSITFELIGDDGHSLTEDDDVEFSIPTSDESDDEDGMDDIPVYWYDENGGFTYYYLKSEMDTLPKETVIRIHAEGYEPKLIKMKYEAGNSTRTISLKREH